MTQLIANGNAYSDDGSTSRDMQHGGFRSWLLPMLRDVLLDAAASTGNAESAGQSAQAAQQSANAAALAAQAAEDALDAIAAIGSGWTPVIGIAIDGARMVLQIRDWTGGRGPKPATGYIGETGLVPSIGDALNIRGAVSYNDLTDRPSLGTAAALDVPPDAAGIATALQVVRGDDPRLVGGTARGALTITSSQNIDRDATFGTATYVLVELWGGGASGSAAISSSAQNFAGGEGGEYVCQVVAVAALPSTIPFTNGAGGAAVTVTTTGATAINAAGNPGGDSSFAGITAYGGVVSVSATSATKSRNFAGANGGYGGGVGITTLNSSAPNARLGSGSSGGPSVHGGGGGGATGVGFEAAGRSQRGGDGGGGRVLTVSNGIGESGAAPAGGGGAALLQTTLAAGLVVTSGAGGRGQLKLTWW